MKLNDHKRAPDGSLWRATAVGISVYRNGAWEDYRLVEGSPDGEALSLAITKDDTVWVAGQSYIARLNPGQAWQIYRVADNPLLLNGLVL